MPNFAYTLAPDRVSQLATYSLTACTPVAGSSTDNLFDLDPSNPLEINELSLDLRWFFPSPQRLDLISIHHSNLNVGLTLQANTSNSFGAPPFSHAIAAPVKQPDDFFTHVALDIAAAEPVVGNRTFLWWRLFNASPNALPIAIGELPQYAALNRLQRNVKWQVTRPEEHGVSYQASKKGVRYIHDRRTRARGVLADLPWATDAGYAAALAWRRGAKGLGLPFVILPGGSDADEPLLARFATTGHSPVLEFLDLNILRLEFEELSCGEAY